MANTERKARKRAGQKLIKEPKVGTPILERAIPTVVDRNGRAKGAQVPHLSQRVMKKRADQLAVMAAHDPQAQADIDNALAAGRKAIEESKK